MNTFLKGPAGRRRLLAADRRVRAVGGRQPQSLEARVGVDKCKAGDCAGIPAIKKALEDARHNLPPCT